MRRRRDRAAGPSTEIRRVGLFGPFGWGNLGDAAIQEAIIHHIRLRLPGVELVGVSLNPENTQEIHGIPAIPIFPQRRAPAQGPEEPGSPRGTARGALARRLRAGSRRVPGLRRLVGAVRRVGGRARDGARAILFVPEIIARLRQLDVLVVSGGGQISDEWGGPWHHPLAMLEWVACARLARTRVYVVGVGAGPIRHPLSAGLFRVALRLAQARSYRDEESRALLAPFGFTRGDPVCPDLAFGLPVGAMPERIDPAGHTTVIGLSPMSFCHPAAGTWPVHDGDRYARYRDLVVEVGRRVLSGGLSLSVFVSQVRNDRYAFDDVVSGLADHPPATGERILAEPTATLSELVSQIARADVVVTSRLHGVILSYLLHKPVVALSYDPKIAAVMRQFDQSTHCLDIETATAALVEERLETLLRDIEEARAKIRSTALSHRVRLEEQFDRLFGAPAHSAHADGRLDRVLDSSLAAVPPMES